MLSRDKQVMAAPPMAAADGGLRRLFEKPLPENPTLLEALSAWNRNVHHHPGNKPIDTASITEIFGELHFHEAPAQQQQPDHHHRGVLLPPPTSPPAPAPRSSPPARAPASWLDIAAEAENKSKDDSSLDALLRPKPAATKATAMKRSASFCAKKGSSASLLLCTEGLGSESTVDSDDMFKDADAEAEAAALIKNTDETAPADVGAAEKAVKEKEEERQQPPKTFPPPIRSIGRGGKPYVCFRSVREDGRFVLREVVIPGKELLQATREGGRLKLQFAAAAVAAAAAAAADVVHGGDDDDDHRGKNSCIDA